MTDPRSPEDWLTELVPEAIAAREKAYAPYSRFMVGAALVTRTGKIFRGCNVENASYPAGICAERTALVSMIASGEREPVAMAVVTEGERGGSPCGICRQMLSEFTRDMPMALVGISGDKQVRRDTNLSSLLPDAFDFEKSTDPRTRK